MNEKNLTASSNDCIRLMRFLGILPEKDHATLSALIGHLQSGTVSAFDLVPKYGRLSLDQKEENKQLGHSLFDALDSEHQEIIVELMKAALSVQPSEKSNMIGAVLAELRGGRSLESVAADLGISPYSLAMYECGCRMPGDSIKARIAEYYGEPVPAIFDEEQRPGNPALAHLVFSHYQTIDAFADAIGWPVKKASRAVANQIQLSRDDMQQIIDHFKVKPEDVAPLFFGTMFA